MRQRFIRSHLFQQVEAIGDRRRCRRRPARARGDSTEGVTIQTGRTPSIQACIAVVQVLVLLALLVNVLRRLAPRLFEHSEAGEGRRCPCRRAPGAPDSSYWCPRSRHGKVVDHPIPCLLRTRLPAILSTCVLAASLTQWGWCVARRRACGSQDGLARHRAQRFQRRAGEIAAGMRAQRVHTLAVLVRVQATLHPELGFRVQRARARHLDVHNLNLRRSSTQAT